MPLTGTSKKAAATPAIRLKDLLDQLDSEWTTLKQDSPEQHGQNEAGLLAYYHTVVRCILPLIGGDPYTVKFPASYAEHERLPKLCGYLRSLQGSDPAEVKAARERNLAGLRAVWPSYQALSNPQGDYPNDHCPLDDEVQPFTWAAIEQSWNGDDADDPARTTLLPTFVTKESADFHLAALAVLYLNRQLKYGLTDLYPHPTGGTGP